MPDDCKECKVSCETESGLHCLLVDDGNKWGWKKIESRGRPDWCPLSPMPEGYIGLVVPGMCCDCKEQGPCCDYSENEDCPKRKDDGSCWVSMEEADG